MQSAYLKASNTDAGDLFGSSLAISGNTIVVGAHAEGSPAKGIDGDQGNDPSFIASGAAYVFVENAGTWSQQAYIKASNTGANLGFTDSLDIDGDTFVAGAVDESSRATGVNGDDTDVFGSSTGAAYIFHRTDTTWVQQAYVKASNTDDQDWFGVSVAISGDSVVVGAQREDGSTTGFNGDDSDNGADAAGAAGAAYWFVRTDTTWVQQAYMKASNTDAIDLFGSAVAASGDTLVVGAEFEDSSATGVNGDQSDNSASNSGAVYVFRP